MKKKTALYFAATIFIFILALPPIDVLALAEEYPEGTDTIGDGAYALTQYMVDITVNEDNSFHIIEHITAHFNVERHGIKRKIPLHNEVVRLDGTSSRNRAKISDVLVGGDRSTMTTEDGFRVLTIGDPDRTITGRKDYAISYTYNIGKDTGKGYDELYFNIIGDQWDTTISNVSFTITMPKAFDASKVGFSHGYRGRTNSSGVTFLVDGNIISGHYDGVLQPGEALTVRLELPEGYFVGARSSNFDLLTVFEFVLPVVLLLITFGIWNKVGRDDPVVETVEFYPPEGFNSADVGFAFRGKVESKDVVSLLIYLANKGYLRIEEIMEEKILLSVFSKRTFNKKGFKIIKVKNYAGGDKREEDFFNGLFAEKDEVGESDLYNKFYVTIGKIVHSYNQRKNREILYNKNSLNKTPLLVFLMYLIVNVLSIRPSLDIEYFAAFLGVFAFMTGLALFMTIVLAKEEKVIVVANFSKMRKILGRVLRGLFVFLVVGGFGIVILFSSWFGGDLLYYLGLAIGTLCFCGIGFFWPRMPKRTPYGNEMLGKIGGFRNFLIMAEKPRLEALVEQDPQYFYNILPYTYALGVSDKWIKKFEGIALQAPDWYDGGTSFSAASFGTFMTTTMAAATTAMTSSPSSDGGGDSGGGSSGGGSGGGGGSSW
jgi:uncharacterized membrane protein